MINIKRSTNRHILVKLLKSKTRRNLDSSQKKRNDLTLTRYPLNIMPDSEETMEDKRQCNSILKWLKEKTTGQYGGIGRYTCLLTQPKEGQQQI